jgi:hypothetical protein
VRPVTKLGAYGVLLAAMFGVGAAVGAAAGPIDVGGTTTHQPTQHTPTTSVEASPHDAHDD